METLFLHIRYLLRHHDCVIIPGIGAFLNLRREASADTVSGIITPASREVCFNSSITNNDGLIASSIARRDCISYEEAQRRLDACLDDMHEVLEEEREVSIAGIGRLHLGPQGRLTFEQRFNSTAFAEHLGYRPVYLPTPEREEALETAEKLHSDKYFYIAINKAFAKAAAIFVGLIVVCLSMFLPFSGDQRMQQEFASVVPIEKVIRKSAPKPAPAPKVEQTKTRIVEESACAGRHYLIVGSFHTLEEAENFAGDAPGMEIVAGKTLFKVSAASSADREEVLAAMRSPEMKSRFSQSWIWSAN